MVPTIYMLLGLCIEVRIKKVWSTRTSYTNIIRALLKDSLSSRDIMIFDSYCTRLALKTSLNDYTIALVCPPCTAQNLKYHDIPPSLFFINLT